MRFWTDPNESERRQMTPASYRFIIRWPASIVEAFKDIQVFFFRIAIGNNTSMRTPTVRFLLVELVTESTSCVQRTWQNKTQVFRRTRRNLLIYRASNDTLMIKNIAQESKNLSSENCLSTDFSRIQTHLKAFVSDCHRV